nr:Type 1 glutamine amidotransferase-like domain-containing protein [Glycomyces sp. L485]
MRNRSAGHVDRVLSRGGQQRQQLNSQTSPPCRPVRTIFLLGGGFSDGRHLDLDRLALDAVPKPKPRVCFIPTASGDSKGYIERFYEAFEPMDCQMNHLELFRRSVEDLDQFLADQDLLYVGGETLQTC